MNCEVQSAECGVSCIIECRVWSAKCQARSVKCGVYRVWSVLCKVSPSLK